MYSSGDRVVIIICVSKIRNKLKRMAPTKDSATSKAELWMKICRRPPMISTLRPAKRLGGNN